MHKKLSIVAVAVGVVALSTSLVGCSTSPTTASNAVASSKTGAASDWYATTYGTFPPITQSGASATVIKLPAGVKAGIVTATYAGTDNFSISALDAHNQPTTDLLVNTVGAYKGVSVFGVGGSGIADATLQVTATAGWTITIADVDTATALPASGVGDGVFKSDAKAGTWTITNTGTSNFEVQQYSANPMPNLAVNEIGNYTGAVPSQDGPSLVQVTSDGTWTIK